MTLVPGHERRCRLCSAVKRDEDFQRCRRTKDGRSNRCKECKTRYERDLYRKKRPPGVESIALTAEQWAAILAAGWLRCRKCLNEKPLDQFARQNMPCRLYYRRICKECQRNDVQLLRRHRRTSRRYCCKAYGITLEQFETMVSEQKGMCALCCRPLGDMRQTIDHDHDTGAIRGIVHWQCNLVLGHANDDPAVLVRAIRYLAKHKQSPELVGRVVKRELLT